jgi:hypothetical protein
MAQKNFLYDIIAVAGVFWVFTKLRPVRFGYRNKNGGRILRPEQERRLKRKNACLKAYGRKMSGMILAKKVRMERFRGKQ